MQKSILLIDDDHKIRKMMAMILTPHGYAISGAQNGTEAMQHLAAQRGISNDRTIVLFSVE